MNKYKPVLKITFAMIKISSEWKSIFSYVTKIAYYNPKNTSHKGTLFSFHIRAIKTDKGKTLMLIFCNLNNNA